MAESICHQLVLKFTLSTDTLINTHSVQEIGIGNIVVIHIDVVPAFVNLQSLRKVKL